MQHSTNFQEGDILVDYLDRYHYLLLRYEITNEEWDLFFAILLENGKQNIWGFNNSSFIKVA